MYIYIYMNITAMCPGADILSDSSSDSDDSDVSRPRGGTGASRQATSGSPAPCTLHPASVSGFTVQGYVGWCRGAGSGFRV